MPNAHVTRCRLALLVSSTVVAPLTTALTLGACTTPDATPSPGCFSASGAACLDASFVFDAGFPSFDAGLDAPFVAVDAAAPDDAAVAGGRAEGSADASDGAVVSIDEWTWMAGSNATLAAGVYGAQGVAAVGNTPGARYGAASWSDAAGRLWLFGGTPVDGIPMMNDLWKFEGGAWAWMGGSNATDALGVYARPDGAP